MVEVKHGKFALKLGFFEMEADISEEDRQCAWELYTEVCTRRALTGCAFDTQCRDFSGEILDESFDSLYAFFCEARGIMRRFPVGRLSPSRSHHLGVLINDLMVNVLRPFLEKWQADYRYWWATNTNIKDSPFVRQLRYPRYNELIQDWQNIRLLMRELLAVLRQAYKLVDVQDN